MNPYYALSLILKLICWTLKNIPQTIVNIPTLSVRFFTDVDSLILGTIVKISTFCIKSFTCIYSSVNGVFNYLAKFTDTWAERGQKIGQIEQKDE